MLKKIQRKYLAGIIIVIFVIIFAVTQFQQNELDEMEPIREETIIRAENKIPENIISWDEKRPLTYDDFQGIIGGPNAENDDVLAQSNIGFLAPIFEIKKTTNGFCQYEIKNYKVRANFDKEKSWIRLDRVERTNSHIETLNHEQRHFDIAEIYSRIAIKLINDESRNKKFPCTVSSTTSLESSIIEEEAVKRILPLESMINEKYQKTQDVYEQEAGQRQFVEKQKKWDAKIVECLDMDLNEINQCLDLYSR